MGYNNKTRTKSCKTPGCSGKIMTDELHRGFNAVDDDGKQICPDCKVRSIVDKYRR